MWRKSRLKETKPEETLQNLGPMISEHRLRRELRILHLTLAIIGLAGTAIAGVLAVWRWLFAYRHYGPAAIERWTSPALWTAMGFAVVGLIGLISIRQSRGLRVNLYTYGMTFHRGRQEETLMWSQIVYIHTAAVRYGLSSLAWGAQTTLELHTNDKRQVRLTHALTNLSSLAETIKRNVYPNLLAEYRRNLNQGDAIHFGPLLLTIKGVQQGQQFLRWQDLSQVALGRGLLLITPHEHSQGARMRIPANLVPNVDLCVQLIEHLILNQAENHTVTPKA